MTSKLTVPKLVREDAAALAEWKRVVPELLERGLAEPLDKSVLAAYCLSWSRYLAAMVWLAENGDVMTLRTDKGEVKSSAVAPKLLVAERSLDRVIKLASLLGLEPAGRAGRSTTGGAVAMPVVETPKVSKADELRARRAARIATAENS
jgi:P27 family predicted phage terminase small subunit